MLAWLTFVAAEACETPYSLAALTADVVPLEAALRADDRTASNSGARAVEAKLPCLTERASMSELSRAYRAIAGGLALDETTRARGIAWFDTGVEVDPLFQYGDEDLPGGSPVWALDAAARSRPGAERVRRGLVPDPRVQLWLDGRFMRSIAATPDRPHVLQLVADGVVTTWVIEGADFPDLPAVPAGPEQSRLEARAARHPIPGLDGGFWFFNTLPVAMAASGLAVAGGGAAMLVVAQAERAKFDGAVNLDEMARYRASVNRLSTLGVGLVVVGAGGIGLGAVYFVDVGGGVVAGPALRVRW
jgi:hypothetical protein